MLTSVYERDYVAVPLVAEAAPAFRTQAEMDAEMARLEREMREAAANLDFERAATLRDQVKSLRMRGLGLGGPTSRR